MGRPKKQNREPYWLAKRNCWYVHHGSTTIRLSPDKGEAWRLWHELMARPPDAPVIRSGPDTPVVQVLDDFLEWVAKNRSPRTYQAYRDFCQYFATTLPRALRVSDFKPYHVTQAIKPNWSNNTRHDFITTIKRAFNWAMDEERIERNPIARTKKPAREARELAISPALYEEVMAAVKEPNFKTLLAFAWESGARVQELRIIEARHVDLEGKRIIIPPKEAKGKKRHRVIYLTEAGIEILKPLLTEWPEGALFRNSEGAAWSKDAINCCFCRLKEKIGRKLHLGAWRKGYATEAIKAGVDLSTLAGLLGHQDARMIATVYSKVTQDQEHMARAAGRAKRIPANDNPPPEKASN